MRIIGGNLRRRRLATPPDATVTRPMPDHVRLALFNLLRGHIEGYSVLDIFAGTGSIGLEAVSRGADRAVFLERDKRIAAILRRNIDDLGVADKCELHEADALSPAALHRCPRPVHLIFMDPPYKLVRDPKAWARIVTQASRLGELLDRDGFLMLRTPWPAVTTEEESPPEPEPRPRRRTKPEARRKAQWSHEAEETLYELDRDGPLPDEIDWAALEAINTEQREEDEIAEAKAPVYRPIPLDIPGMDGPETHIYGKTAVHLYAPAPTRDQPETDPHGADSQAPDAPESSP